METVSRNTFFLKPKDGGINVISLPLKAQALRQSSVVSGYRARVFSRWSLVFRTGFVY